MPRHQLRHCMIVDNHFPDMRVEREARALADRGFAVDVICADGGNRRERLGPITIYRLPVHRRRGASIGVQLVEYVTFLAWAMAMATRRHLRKPYDSVQVHNVPDFLVFSALVPKLQGAAIILDIHDLMPEFFASRFGGNMEGALVRTLVVQEQLSAAFADRVLTVTEHWRQTLIERGIAADKVAVVMNLPDERIFVHRDPVIRDGPLTVVYHGTLTRRYGLDVLLSALAKARERVPLRLLVHGHGEYLEPLRHLAETLGLGEHVEFSTELVPVGQLPDIIGQADIGVVPNRSDLFTDGILPTKLSEYAALGIPAIVSRSSAVEAYFSSDMVRFVPAGDSDALADALCELATTPELRRSLATQAQRFSDEHRWKDEARRYVDLVEQAIADKQGILESTTR